VYKVNGKNLSVGRLMVRGKEGEKRLKYIHVGPKGTSVITPIVIARVGLPDVEQPVIPSAVISQATLDAIKLPKPESTDIIELPEGEPAITGPTFLVPQIDKCFPGPEYQVAAFTCNAELLRKLLTVACEVSKDSDKTVRLRICNTGDTPSLRIDAYRTPGDQEFCGVLKGIDYDGGYIPGEAEVANMYAEKKPQQQGMVLKVSTGRKFK
jgi:hypothetical protein